MMKRFVIFCLILVLRISASAQLLSVSPSFPADTSSITIIADCSKGNQGLLNYGSPGDVYVHLGVITNLSTSKTDWRYVKFNQNFNLPNAALQATYLGNNKYSFNINSIRNYFGVAASETILKIAILFRNGAGNAVLRNSDGSDMYINIYGPSLSGKFLSPPFQPLYTPQPDPINLIVGDILQIHYVSNAVAGLYIYANGTFGDSVHADTAIQFNYTITGSGNQQIVAIENDGQHSRSDTFNFFVSAPVTIAPLPAGVKDGINYLPGDSSVILALFAPGKNKAVVVGDFNSWALSPAFQMNQTPDGKYFWIQINGLTPGVEYGYQFVIDNNLKLADYYTEKILDPDNDPSISAAVYPNLKAYPTGKTTGLVSVLQTAAPAYPWKGNSFARPAKNSLNIYEVLVRDFTSAHTFAALRDTLNYLKSLGINAVELMPVNEFEGNSSWGYNPSFYFAPDKYYGPKNTLKELIDSCHSKGMAVIMDIVLNHSFGQSPMVQMYFNQATGQPAADNPWFNVVAPHQSIQFGYDFNHTSDATKYFVDRVLQFWLTEYKMDGFRFDFTKGFTQKQTNNDNDLSAYDTGRINILKRINHTVQTASQNAYVILEHFAVNTEELDLAADGMMLWGNANYNFNQATMGYLDNNGSDFSQAIYSARGYSTPNLVSYMESHDEERIMYKNLRYGNANGSYVIKGDTINSLKRDELAAVFYLSIPGPKMIWQFGELGYDYSRCYLSTNGEGGDCNTKTDPKPLRWDYLKQAPRKKLHDIFAGLLSIRHDYPALNSPSAIVYNLNAAFKSLLVSSSTLNIAAIGDFDVTQASGTINFQHSGVWYNYFGGDSLVVSNTNQNFNLSAGEYRLYLDKKITDSTTAGTGGTQPQNLSLKIYPNPVKAVSSTIKYELPEDGVIYISVFNVLGQKVFSTNRGMQAKGEHELSMGELPLDPLFLKNDIYIMELRSNQNRTHFSFLVQH